MGVEVIKRMVLATGLARLIWVLSASLVAYISLVPFYYFQPQSLTQAPSFSLIKYGPFVLACGILCLWGFERLFKIRAIISTSVDRWICIHLGVSLLSLWGAEYVRIGLVKWIYYHATGPVLCFIVVQYFSAWKTIRYAAVYLAVITGVVAVYTVFFAAIGWEPFWDSIQREYSPYHTRNRAMGPFGHTVATASYVMFLLPLGVWTFVHTKAIWPKVGWGLVCLLFVPAVLSTQTRGTQVATLLSCGLLIPWLRKLGPVIGRLGGDKVRGLTAGGIVVLMLRGGWWWRSDGLAAEIQHRWSEILDFRSVTIRDGDKVYQYDSLLEYTERFRIAQYYTVGNILAEHPLTGVGFGTFTREFEKYRYAENYMVREFPEHTTENMYLMFLAETGLVGLIARIALLAAIGMIAFRAWRKAVEGPRKDM